MVRIYIYIYIFPFTSFPISTCCSSLPFVGPHTLSFFPLQASIPPLAADPSPCPTPTTPIDLFILHPYLSAISFFLYSVSQSFSVSNTKTHSRRSWLGSVPKRFVGGLSAKTVGALLPSPPPRRWVHGWVAGIVVCGVWLLCGSLWIAYLGFKISNCLYCVLFTWVSCG